MADVKAQLQRVVELAKKHPYIAGGLVLGVGVLGYLAYKNGGGEGGSDGEVSGGASIDQSGGTSPGLFDGGSIPSVTTPQEVFVTPDTSNIFSPPSAPSVNSGNGGGSSLFDDLFSPVSPVVPAYNPVPSVGMLPATAATLPSANITEDIIPDWSTVAVLPKSEKTQAIIQMAAEKIKAPTLPKDLVKSIDTSGWSPAKILGKGQNYTGYIGAAYYVNGFPQSIGQQAVKNISKVTLVPKLATSIQPASQKPKPLKKAKE